MNDRTRDLNELIVSQEAMIESYARLIAKVKDTELKKTLKSLQESHFNQMMLISDRVVDIGEEPQYKIGLKGVMDDMRQKRSREKEMTDIDYAEIALDAERIIAEKHASFKLGEADPTSVELLHMTINEDEENIKALEEYIQRSKPQ